LNLKVRQPINNDTMSGKPFALTKTTTSRHVIRYATAADASQLLSMMKQLAVFEGYADQFKVTERVLLERGLASTANMHTTAQFTAIVAASDGIENSKLLGYAVVYEIPFTFDLRPILVLKELFVAEDSRSGGLGGALMQAVLAHAHAGLCGRLKWDVLPSNEHAKAFYRRWGGQPVCDWEAWRIEIQ
jgi:GNAT superfamily N-acetyltransferase